MIALYAEGQTLAAIGERFGCSRERVRQLIKKYGGPDFQQLRQRRVAVNREQRQARGEVSWETGTGGTPTEEVP